MLEKARQRELNEIAARLHGGELGNVEASSEHDLSKSTFLLDVLTQL